MARLLVSLIEEIGIRRLETSRSPGTNISNLW